MNSFLDMIRRRRSCRAYASDPLSEEVIREMIDNAVWVPNGSNNQPWSFVVITDKVLLQHYSDVAKSEWLDNLTDSPHMHQYEQFMRDPDFNVFYNAPALVIIYGNRESFWHVYDCSMVAYNLSLLAEEAGLGSCWIGFAHNIFSKREIKSEFGLSENYQLVAPIIVGHPAELSPGAEVPRKPYILSFYHG
ncbi:MAG: nitroreductase [Geobacteraceae bacterium]